MHFSEREIKDLLIAWVLISVAFAIAMGMLGNLVTGIWVAGLTVGIAFIVHELAHKFVAQRYKKFAEFHASIPMLIGAIVVAFTGIVIAAPGAVVVSGFVSKRQNGIISAAGPLSNMILAMLLIPLFLFLQEGTIAFILVGFSIVINAWLALFNLIPFGPFDGAKIFAWDKKVYTGLGVLAVVLMFFSTYINAF